MCVPFPDLDTCAPDRTVLLSEIRTQKYLVKSRLDVSSLPSEGSGKPNGRAAAGRQGRGRA